MTNAHTVARQRGIASLYITSLRADRSALVRTQAVNLANDIADRIRSNRAGKDDYASSKYDKDPAESQDCATASCTPAAIAQEDMFLWQGNIKKYLPTGSAGTVEYKASAGPTEPGVYTIAVQWPEQGNPQPNSTVLIVEL
jgi:type IV pilus assembly protein PilV